MREENSVNNIRLGSWRENFKNEMRQVKQLPDYTVWIYKKPGKKQNT
jgi:hypothetical protein